MEDASIFDLLLELWIGHLQVRWTHTDKIKGSCIVLRKSNEILQVVLDFL